MAVSICFRSVQLEKGAIPTLKKGLDKDCPMPKPSAVQVAPCEAVEKLEHARVKIYLFYFLA